MTDEARELQIFIANDAKLWGQCEGYFRNLEKHKAKGRYDSARAASGLETLTREAAKSYGVIHCTGTASGLAMFSAECRRDVAATLIADFECEYESGNRWGS